MPCFGLWLGKVWQVYSKPKHKVMMFSITTPHQSLLNHFMSSIWMFQCATSSWWPICVTPCTFFTVTGKSLAGMQQTQAKVMVFIQPWHQLLLNHFLSSIWIQ
jgi:hypothetical protein